jgi:hypothetical protein
MQQIAAAEKWCFLSVSAVVSRRARLVDPPPLPITLTNAAVGCWSGRDADLEGVSRAQPRSLRIGTTPRVGQSTWAVLAALVVTRLTRWHR